MQGVPVRVEVGPRDLEQGTCVTVRRDQPGKAGKTLGVPLEPSQFVTHIKHLLEEVAPMLTWLYDSSRMQRSAVSQCRYVGCGVYGVAYGKPWNARS